MTTAEHLHDTLDAADAAWPSGSLRRVRDMAVCAWPRLRPILPWVFICLGVGLRCHQYASDRSLFLDEAFVATNIARKSFADLLGPLLFDQRAPAGFLLGVKAFTLAFGRSDLVLRLLPLLSGGLSVVAMYAVGRRYAGRGTAALAVLMFALSSPLIFYASELKQYSTDLLVTLLVLLSFASTEKPPLSAGRILLIGGVGALACWFSFTAVFVLAGVGACFVLWNLSTRQWSQLWRFGIVAALWALGCGTVYLVQLRHLELDPQWKWMWGGGFMPLPPTSLRDLRWFVDMARLSVSHQVGLSDAAAGIAGIAALFGLKSLYQTSKYRLALLVAPLAVLLLASGLTIYPFSGRVALFVAPIPLLLIAAGIRDISRRRETYCRWLACAMALILLFSPAAWAFRHVTDGTLYINTMYPDYRFEEAKPAMAYVRDHWRDGDVVYLYSESSVAFEHYAEQFGFRETDFIRGIPTGFWSPEWSEIRDDLRKLRGRPRVWVFFSRVHRKINGVDEKRLCLFFLDEMGRRLDHFETFGSSEGAAYLYDLTDPASRSSRSNYPPGTMSLARTQPRPLRTMTLVEVRSNEQ